MQINRDSGASLIALIAVKPDHPASPPVFCLNLHWNGEYNLHNCEYVRALEKEVNTSFVEESKEILALQIKRLMACFDALLESWQKQGDKPKSDFARENLFLHNVRGRRRQLPIKFDSQLQMFTQ